MSDPLRRVTGLSVDAFAAAHWDVAPLLRRAAHHHDRDFSDLLSRDAIDELLSRRGLRTPFVRMTRNGEIIPPARYTRSGGAGAEISDQVADDKVLAEFASGATLVLQGLHRMWPPLQDFANDFSAQLGHPVQINAYVTPPENQGFSAHYDVHDVFVLQFAGRKRWRVHEPVWTSPLRDQPWHRHRAAVVARSAEEPLIDAVLECGDALYLPRGFLHAAASLGDFSGHLTIGVHPVTRRTIADQLLGALGDDADMRRALPAGIDLSDATALDSEITATIASLHAAIDRIDRGEIARGIARHLAGTTRPAPLRPLEQLAAAATLTPETHVRRRPGLHVTVRCEQTDCIIALPDKDVRITNTGADAVRAATSGAVVSAAALPHIETADAVALLAQLLREGIIVPV